MPEFDIDAALSSQGVPRCPSCGMLANWVHVYAHDGSPELSRVHFQCRRTPTCYDFDKMLVARSKELVRDDGQKGTPEELNRVRISFACPFCYYGGTEWLGDRARPEESQVESRYNCASCGHQYSHIWELGEDYYA